MELLKKCLYLSSLVANRTNSRSCLTQYAEQLAICYKNNYLISFVTAAVRQPDS